MTTTEEPTAPDPTMLDAFVGRFVTDLAAVAHAATVVIGDKLGLYQAMAEHGPATVAELAAITGCDERYLREWLSAQVASEYAHHDATTDRFWLDPVQVICLGDPTNPGFLAGGMTVASSMHKDEEKVAAAFRTGAGVGWHEHHHDLFLGTERFFRPGYAANLVDSWIPALDGVQQKLEAGASVADVGCGHGASTLLLAEAFPNSRFVGFDYHGPSIEVARQRAADAGLGDRVRFEVAGADEFSGTGYDLVCIFDALHDMGDPVAAAAHIHAALDSDGTWLLVEPAAGDALEDNLNVVGRIFYSASTLICTPGSRSQPGARCLGAQAGDARLREVVAAGGFTRFRRATATPFNAVLDVRP
jgi:SAM-dependent methyltransferase